MPVSWPQNGNCRQKQKAAIFGTNRGFSCDFCDVHLSEKEWLDNHNQGEKHRWVSERVKLLLPVQWIQPPPKTVPRGPNVPPELVCVVCQQGFWPLEKYRWEKFSWMHFNNWPQKKFPLIEHSTPGNTLGASIIWRGARATQWKNSSLNQVVVWRISQFQKEAFSVLCDMS